MDLLQFIVDHQLNGNPECLRIPSLMTNLYSIRWVEHPARDDQKNKLRFYLDSLLETGELKKGKSIILQLEKRFQRSRIMKKRSVDIFPP